MAVGVYQYYGTSTLTNVTISGNSADDGGGMYKTFGTLTLRNTLVARNTAGSGQDLDLFGGTLSGTNNLIGDGSGQSSLVNGTNGNLVGTTASPIDPKLAEGSSSGIGLSPLPGSPAIDAGDNSFIPTGITTDVYGSARIQGARVNIGAVETVLPGMPGVTYVVTGLADGIASDGVLTLREALAAANSNQAAGDAPAGSYSLADRIEFAPGLTGTILTGGQAYQITGSVALVGPGLGQLTLDARGSSRVVDIRGMYDVSLSGMTLTGGNSGGISAVNAHVTLNSMAISRNAWARGSGGGMYLDSCASTLTNVTISGNSAGSGGGLYQYYGTSLLTNVTISGNSADSGGGMYKSYGTSTLRNTLVARNAAGSGPDLYLSSGTLSGANNLIGDGSGQSSLVNGTNGNLVGTTASPIDPKLAEGSSSGIGLSPLPGSPAIDAGDNSFIPTGITTDVYGSARIQGARVNIGAVETVLPGMPGVTYVVTGLADSIASDGVLTLREALAAANSNQAAGDAPAGSYSSADRIEFAPGVTGTILTGGQAYQITGSVTLVGPGLGQLTLDARGSSRVVDIRGMYDVSISGMTLTGGNAVSGSGGGIYAGGVHLALTNVTISGNSTEEYGGGIYQQSGTSTLTNVTISGNSAVASGGGMYKSYGTSTLRNTLVARNAAGSGPDLYLSSGTLSGANNLIGDGSGQSSLVNGTNGNLVGTTASPIDPKLAEGSSFGIGLSPLPGSPAIDAGDNSFIPTGITTDVYGSARIQGARVNIGAVETVLPGMPGVTYVVTGLADSIASDGVLTLREALAAANSNQAAGDAPAGSYSSADRIEFAPGVTGTILTGGQAYQITGSVTLVGPGLGQLTLDARGSSRVVDIRGMYDVSISGMTLTGGNAVSGSGGGIYAGGVHLALTNVTISGNSASNGSGGGIFQANGTSLLTNVTIGGNSAWSGGGMHQWAGTSTLTNVAISGNAANYGGGLDQYYSTSTLTNVTISGNSALGGGGVDQSNCTSTLTNVTISGNSASGTAGGVSQTLGTLTLTNVTISGNSANVGGGMHQQQGTAVLTNVTVSGNSATEGGGLSMSYATSTLRNTIVARNAANRGPDLSLYSGTLSGANNLIGDGSGQSSLVNGINGNLVGTTSVPVDPQFVQLAGIDWTKWDLRLQASSPAVNTGNNAWIPSGVTTDITGSPRIINGTVDIGAYEREQAPTDLALSATSVAENQPAGTVVGDLSTTDPDAGDTFTYSLVSGTGSTDNGSFTISGNQLKTAASFNYETKSTYSIRIRTTDAGGLTFDKVFPISVTNVNETPTDITLAGTVVPENQPAGTDVGSFTTTDPDVGDTFTYSLVSGTGSADNASFRVSGSQLKTAARFDVETKASYSIRVRTTDAGGLTFDTTFTIGVVKAVDVQQVGHCGGAVNAVTVVGTLAYVCQGQDLLIFDIRSPASPVRVGVCVTANCANGVSVAGNYAYVADNSSGLQVIDISNPASPVWVGGYDTAGVACGVSVVGNYAYVADNSSGLQVIDISNPASPVRVGGYDTAGAAMGVSVVGNYAYVADLSSGLQVINISNPASPVRVGGYDTAGSAYGVSVVGNYAYVADNSSGLQVIDISNPASPVRVGGYDTAGSAYGVSVVGDYAYVADGSSGLEVIDIRNPAAPVRVGGYDTGDYAWGASVAGKYAYVADPSSGLHVIDISNPASPVRVGGYDTAGYARGVSVLGNYAYVSGRGLEVIDISNPASPVWAGGYDTGGYAYGVSVVGNYAYVADLFSGLQVIDISNPASPVRVGGYDTAGLAWGVSVVGNYAYVADGYSGLQVINISNPASPVRVGGYDTAGQARGVSVVGNYAYVADDSSGLQVINISNPASPVWAGGYDTGGYAYGVSVVGNYAYVADYTSGLQVINISNPASPVRVGGYDTAGAAMGVSVVGNYAYVADFASGLHVIDISNPASCVRVGGYDVVGYAYGVSVVGSYAYVADASNGLVALRIGQDLPPTDISISASSIAENQPVGTVVGNFSTTDPDVGNTFTYALVAGTGSTDNASFTISGNQLKTAASFNFEVKSVYSIRVRTTDAGGLTFDKEFTISVTNVNEQPTDISLSAATIPENQASGTVVGNFSTADPDAEDTFTYSLVSGTGSTDNASFTISGNQLKTAATFDYETKSTYSIRVRTTDAGGLTFERVFTIVVSRQAIPATTGKIGNALSFNGSDNYADMGDPADNHLDIGTNATIEAWVKFDSIPSGTFATIGSKDAGGGQYEQVDLRLCQRLRSGECDHPAYQYAINRWNLATVQSMGAGYRAVVSPGRGKERHQLHILS